MKGLTKCALSPQRSMFRKKIPTPATTQASLGDVLLSEAPRRGRIRRQNVDAGSQARGRAQDVSVSRGQSVVREQETFRTWRGRWLHSSANVFDATNCALKVVNFTLCTSFHTKKEGAYTKHINVMLSIFHE